MRRALGILLVIGCAGIVVRWLWIHRSARLDSDEMNVCEAVFRYQIDSLAQSIPGQVSMHYLSVKGVDPPKELIERLKAGNIPVERGSFFKEELWEKGAWHSVIRDIERLDDRTFVVHGGYENNGLSASGEDYTVVYHDGRWNVDKVVGRWVA